MSALLEVPRLNRSLSGTESLSSSHAPAREDVARLEALQRELQQRERELVEQRLLGRFDTLKRVREVLRHLGELGSLAGILDHAAGELGAVCDFERILIGEVQGELLVPRALWQRDASPGSTEAKLAELQEAPVALEYPLVECDVARGQDVALVEVQALGSRTPAGLRELLGWRWYAAGAIVIERETAGLLHADTGKRPAGPLDSELVALACAGLGELLDRAILREALQRHRSELQSAMQWIGRRLTSLAAGGELGGPAAGDARDGDAVAELTARELEVLALMARGQTNAAIARELVVQVGTVKYHVKNVLRKLGARSRADAVARYVRATGS